MGIISCQLEFPIGSYICWHGEFYKVLTSSKDYCGTVLDVKGNECLFYFGKREVIKPVIISDENKIKELDKLFKNLESECQAS